MACWIFVMAGNNSEFKERIKTKRWELYKRTNNRLNIRKGDKILFYLARYPRRKFVANGALSSNVRDDDDCEFSVGLYKLRLWKIQIPIRPLIDSLKFIRDKEKWGRYMQGGIIRISEKDYDFIMKQKK